MLSPRARAHRAAMGRKGRRPKDEGGGGPVSEEGADAGEAPPPVFAGGRPRTRPCAGCKRVRRRCEGGRPCARCFEFVIPCAPLPGAQQEPAEFSLEVCFASADYQAHAGAFAGAIERLAAQGLCSRERAATVMSAWQRLALAASGTDVTHGVARRVGALLGINVPSVLAGGSNGASDGSGQGRKGAGRGGGARAAITAALKEQQRLLACGERLEAKGAIRWGPAFESGAILCEALCRDQLALAGNGHLQRLFQGAAAFMATAFKHVALPSLLLVSLMDPICRDAWFDSLAYMTFAERVRPRTHIFKVADKDGCIRLFLVALQRFDVGDGRGGFAIAHKLEPAPDSRYLVPRWAQRLLNPPVPHDDPSEAFHERQQALRLQRRTRWGPDGWGKVEGEAEAEAAAEAAAGADEGNGAAHHHHSAVVATAGGAAAAAAAASYHQWEPPMAPLAPPAFRGVAAWAGFDADTPAYVWRAVEAAPATVPLPAQAALFAPRSKHHLRLLRECGRVVGLGVVDDKGVSAAVKEQAGEEGEEEKEEESDGGGSVSGGMSPLAAMGAALAAYGGGANGGEGEDDDDVLSLSGLF